MPAKIEHMRSVLTICLLFLPCFVVAYAKQDVIAIVTGYEQALMTYDSRKTVQYMHPQGLREQFGSVDNYHSSMSRAFESIKSDGGIESTEKGSVYITGDVAHVVSTMKTKTSVQSGVLELRKHDEQWLIYKLP